ncbi:Putative threonine efflux protein [Corynebacterium camporealensis]|uniref:Putative threonine efflux protein n=1 Tax=Corynebacterium camporealensis TaxID=161896 RepID=A0A0F6QV61_9CORY|nr:LysE family translocator [Corynebacterium camporealensis]AKE38647.1 putative threonine efflux protein [Corynebacterium camporealensis]AVH87934.1 Putative threonine efflux protein [Corynebacterium camporealensis]
MDLGLALGFWGVSALLSVTPGSDWAYAMAAALQNRSPLPAVIGLVGGHFLASVVVAAGVGAIVSQAPIVLTILTVIGALYLMWLGIVMLRNPPVVEEGEAVAESSVGAQLGKGFGVSGLNPKLYLLALVLIPQFVDPQQWMPVGLQMLIIGMFHVVNVTVVYLTVAYGARIVLRTRPAAARIVAYASGIIMLAIGAYLLFEEFFVG